MAMLQQLRMAFGGRINEPRSLAEARELAGNNRASYEALIAAGRYFLYNSGHLASVVVESERCFRRALRKLPHSVEAMTYVGFSLDNQGRWTEARQIYERVLEIDPNYELARERYAAAVEELDIVDEPAAKKPARFTRFPETIASLADLDRAIDEHVLSHISHDSLSLTAETRIVTVGSCFAANLAVALKAHGIAAHNLTVGEIINSTYANLQFFRWALDVSSDVGEDIESRFGKDEVGALLKNAEVIIYTLGVAPCFFDKATGAFALPKRSEGVRGVLSGKYLFRTTTVEENHCNLASIVALVREVNPACKFVFSLSPVPLTATLEPRSAMEADCLSKATLRVAVEQLLSSTPRCIYWPAFEIVRWLGTYISGMYGEEDGTTHHLSERVIRTIIQHFLTTYRKN
jgi:hypothetical protein